ncbi:macro domain-containing protein [uncultured Fusobacterium sp.]|uniref:Appr-1-p processing protein n=1 Tax=uncultured Fusobacterium sp. TaxID=159267 RepID=UPI00259426E7|nr:Appr-1-p processing protein [uncultured Fusobacterium sp.]
MKKIHYLKGDAVYPQARGNIIITHICNDIGVWGRGFVVALSARWMAPEIEYLIWRKEGNNFSLGNVQFVKVTSTTSVANMIAQHDIIPKNGVPPIRYEALEICLEKIAQRAVELEASIHMPRIGCGFAGGSWKIIEDIIFKTLISKNIEVYVYDL